MAETNIAALQIGSSPSGTAETLANVMAFEGEIRDRQLSLVVMPEALLGGYPKGEDFGTRVGYRLAEGRDTYARYHAQAVALDGPELTQMTELSRRTNATIVVGVIERAAASLFCTAVFIEPTAGVVAWHRKLMPTGSERLIWSQGDASTMPIVDSHAGRLGAAICWENHMPLFRTAMYAKGVEIWCAPTVDEREIWRCSMRHIAHEGRCFVVSACQVQPPPVDLGLPVHGWDARRPLIGGGSMVVGPFGDVLAGPLEHETALVTAQIDLKDLVRARLDLDVVGHYARPDLFELHVRSSPLPGTVFSAREALSGLAAPKLERRSGDE